jgi:hypothetical protein
MRGFGVVVMAALVLGLVACGDESGDKARVIPPKGSVLGGDVTDLPREDREYIACLRSGGVSVLISPTIIRLAKEATEAARAGRRVSRNYRYSFGLLARDEGERTKQLRVIDACRAKHWRR